MVNTGIIGEGLHDLQRVARENIVCFAAQHVARQIIKEIPERVDGFALIATFQLEGYVFAQNDGRRFGLALRRFVRSTERNQIAYPTLETVERVHDRDCDLAVGPALEAGKDNFGDAAFERFHLHAHYRAKKVYNQWFAVDLRLDDRGLRCVIIEVRFDNSAAERMGQFLRSFTIAEIVDIFGGERSILREFVCTREIFSPEVEGLAANDESPILKVEVGRDTENRVVLEVGQGQATR